MAIFNTVYGGEPKWKPGSNTVAYYPLTTDFNDASGNSRNLTNTNVSNTTLSGVECAYFDGSSSYLTYSGYSLGNTARTINLWSYGIRPNSSNNGLGVIHIANPSTNTNFGGTLGIQYRTATQICTSDWKNSSSESQKATISSGWNNVVVTQEGTTVKLYLNGALQFTNSSYPSQEASPTGWRLGASCRSQYIGQYFKGYLSRVVLENKVRTAEEVSKYYNSTKGNY